ncbi:MULTISPECIES: hypothetical protein [Virgibacillus]|uniref:hypothetical protein n=1 Tax=Virgibacillus TaxID=84406 RepID=UPI00098B0E16|nr:MULTISPECIES: hypothetical protein [Virgibacillus]
MKANFPTEFSKVNTRKTALNEIDEKIDPKYPTLIIRKDGKTIERISGQTPKHVIISKLEKLM